MKKSFVAKRGERTVADVLRRAGEAETAIDEGRVFVGRRRVRRSEEAVSEGGEVIVQPGAPGRAEGVATAVLAEWRGLYAVSKPAGISTEPDRRGARSVIRQIEAELRLPEGRLHAVTRLDAMVSGIVVLASGSDATRLAVRLKGDGSLRRRYFALSCRQVEPSSGTWDAPIGEGPGGQRRVGGRAARPARTRYATVDTAPAAGDVRPTLLVLEPVTGRTHQLRVHAAAAGAPLLGDAAYGGPRRLVSGDGLVTAIERVALHAGRVLVAGPSGVEWCVTAPAPPDLTNLWSTAGGRPTAWEDALTLAELDAS